MDYTQVHDKIKSLATKIDKRIGFVIYTVGLCKIFFSHYDNERHVEVYAPNENIFKEIDIELSAPNRRIEFNGFRLYENYEILFDILIAADKAADKSLKYRLFGVI